MRLTSVPSTSSARLLLAFAARSLVLSDLFRGEAGTSKDTHEASHAARVVQRLLIEASSEAMLRLDLLWSIDKSNSDP